MSVRFVRAPNNPILIAAGAALLLLALLHLGRAMVFSNEYRIPVAIVAGSAIIDAILGIALLYAAFSRSQFAGATAVIVATVIIFGVIAGHVLPFSPQVTWWTAIYLGIAGAVLWPSIFPWSRTANKPVLFWMALTFGTLTLVGGTLVLLARP